MLACVTRLLVTHTLAASYTGSVTPRVPHSLTGRLLPRTQDEGMGGGGATIKLAALP